MPPRRRRRPQFRLSFQQILEELLQKYLKDETISCLHIGYSPDLKHFYASTLRGLSGVGKTVEAAVRDLHSKKKSLMEKYK